MQEHEVTGTLVIGDAPGRPGARYEWNGNVDDRAAARAAFEAAIRDEHGVFASVSDSPGHATQVQTFDEIEQIERERGTVTVRVHRQLVGG